MVGIDVIYTIYRGKDKCKRARRCAQVCEGEMSALVAQIEASQGRAATAEAASQEARMRSQQLEVAAATAQETVERMQSANQDLIKMCVLLLRTLVRTSCRESCSLSQLIYLQPIVCTIGAHMCAICEPNTNRALYCTAHTSTHHEVSHHLLIYGYLHHNLLHAHGGIVRYSTVNLYVIVRYQDIPGRIRIGLVASTTGCALRGQGGVQAH